MDRLDDLLTVLNIMREKPVIRVIKKVDVF